MSRAYSVQPTRFAGEIRAVPSKSDAHRALIAAALACGESRLSDWGDSDDVQATLRALETLGLVRTRSGFSLSGGGEMRSDTAIACGQSGSTLRFLIPLTLALGEGACFTGAGRLMQRPLSAYERLFTRQGIGWRREGQRLAVSGRLEAGLYELPGDVSSQFVTGLCFALPLLERDSQIRFTSPLESAGYVSMTLETLRRFGIVIHEGAEGLDIPGGQRYRPAVYAIEGDWSYGAFWLAAGAMGGDVTVRGLKSPSLQGDSRVADILWEMGAAIAQSGDAAHACGGALQGVEVSLADVPDLAPVLAVAACAAHGRSRFTQARRLRIKESDRLAAIGRMVTDLGGRISLGEDEFTIEGAGRIAGGAVETRHDHRMAMAAAVAAAASEGPVRLDDGDCVAKSAPDFWRHYHRLGGICDE